MIQEQASSLKEQAAEITDLKARLEQVEKVVLERQVSLARKNIRRVDY